jgi:two-component system phosphate regulon sensor histidine kinase PhoR
MTRRQKFGIFLFVILVFAFALVLFAATFLLTGLLYERLGLHPSPLLAHVINSALGLVLSFVMLSIIGRIFGPKQRALQNSVFGPIIEAMQRIAKGDFSVQVEDKFGDDGGIMVELAKNVNSMAGELRQLEQMRQEFISNVSHELQSPLTSIRGFARALQDDGLAPDERHHYLGIIETESTRLSRITENLLKLATLEARHVKFEPKPYRLDKQIRALVLACEPQWTSEGIEMGVSLAEVDITADEDLLSQVWMNLLANSIKFTPGGGRICVDLYRQDGRVIFKITDTGIGIAPDDIDHIFERFYKADKSRTHSKNGGSGLGLSIVQKIVEMHGGEIAVTSQPGAGTAFTISLPAEQRPVSPASR